MSKLLPLMREGMKAISSTKRFDRISKTLELVNACSSGKCTFQFVVSEEQLNAFGTLHGGYTAYMVDGATSCALMGMERKKAGVSVDMSISYLNPARTGDLVTVETECKKYGYNLVFMEAVFKNEEGKVLAIGKHTKFLGDGRKPNTGN